MVDVTPRSLNPDTEVAGLPVLNTTGEVIAYAYIGRDGSVTGLDNNPEALRYFLQSLSAGEGRQLGDIINMLPNDASREAFMGQVQRLAENLSLEPEYARSVTVGDRQYNVRVNAEGELEGVTREELLRNSELLKALLRNTTEEQRTALHDAMVPEEDPRASEFASAFVVAEGQVAAETRARATPPPAPPLPTAERPDWANSVVAPPSADFGVGVGVTFGGQTAPATTTIWSYGINAGATASPALDALIAARASLALAPADQQQLEAAATRGDITLDEAQKIVAIDTRLDEIERLNGDDDRSNDVALGTKADGTPYTLEEIRAQFAEARAAMIAPDGKHEGQTVEQELGALVAMVPQDASLRQAAGRGV